MPIKIAVLGGGPGGYAAAFLAADEGLDVTLVEPEARLGGTCLLRGCIPSKAFLHVARIIAEVDELRADWGVEYSPPLIQPARLLERKNKIISTLSQGLAQLAKRRKVRVIQARGVFENSNTLRFEGAHESIPPEGRESFDYIVLATGSTPAIPPSFQIESTRVMDSTSALEISHVPQSLLVIGGGYIGLEMGTVYARLGARVSVVELTGGLLPGVDPDLVRPLQRNLEELFEKRLFLNTRVGSLGERGGAVEVAFEGPGKYGVERFEKVLVAVGRRPCSQGIGLENTQVRLDKRGFALCDEAQRTHDPHILAIGDVAGEPMLAHKATHQGKVAIERLVGKPAVFDKLAIPAVVFTDPEIAWAGLSETQAQKEGRDYEVAVYPWAASGRAQAVGRVEGLTKWLVDPATQRVIGCGIVGPGAGEMIAEGVLAIEMGCEVRDITESVHPHPTLSETLMNAGEVVFGTATELYKPKTKEKA